MYTDSWAITPPLRLDRGRLICFHCYYSYYGMSIMLWEMGSS